MKRIVTVFLAILLLFPGIVTAADKKTGQDQPASAAAKAIPQKLDLNRASREELIEVPGIGPRMAQAIVDLRHKKGSFSRVEDLLEVSGIKEKKLAALTVYLEVVPLKISTAATPVAESK